MGTRTRSASKADTTRRLQEGASASPAATPAQEIAHLKRLLAWYVYDESRYLKGEGEPFGSISTEVGMMARIATRGVSR
jgi:hypothetical protein